MNRNPNCDGGECWSATGEVRLLPTGGESNGILCRGCFNREITWRRERNKDLAPECQFALPNWEALEVYKP